MYTVQTFSSYSFLQLSYFLSAAVRSSIVATSSLSGCTNPFLIVTEQISHQYKAHRDLQVDVVTSEIQKFAQKHEGRLHHHENVEAVQLLDNTCIVRRLQRKKTF